MERWLVIANPVAGRGRSAARLRELEAALRRRGVAFDLALTQGRRHAESIAAGAARGGIGGLVAVGGDGTVHEVANGLLSEAGPAHVPPLLAVLPVGTGNDWARTLGAPSDPAALAGLIAAGAWRHADAGRVAFLDGGREASRHFVNVAGAGFDAHVVRQLGDRKGGTAAYLGGLLRGLRSFEPPVLSVDAGQGVRARQLFVLFASLGRWCGGGMKVNPSAPLAAGRLRLTEIAPMSGLQVLGQLRRLFDGSIERSPFVRASDVPRVTISGPAPAGVEADGEWLGTTPATISVLPRALRVVCGERCQLP